jgi:hypothetical protein
MRLLLSNNKHVGTKIGWKHGTNSNQLYRPEARLTVFIGACCKRDSRKRQAKL